MRDFDLSVTICSWNTQGDLRACLQSLAEVRDECSFEVIVIDNASHDGSPDMVEAEFPWVRLFRMKENLGFTGGHNYAMEQRKGRHAFLLNSDATVLPGCLKTLLEFADATPKAGIIGPKILNPDGSLQLSCRTFPNPMAALFRNTIIGKLFPNNRFTREYLMADWSHDQSRTVDWVSGAAMLATESLMEKIGFMDPAFFMYCEDVDWCWRAWQAGYEVIYLPQAVCTHAIGRSTDKAANKMIVRFHRSMLYFYKKNMLPTKFILFRPFLWLFAAGALGLRASTFIMKNWIDEMKRRMSR